MLLDTSGLMCCFDADDRRHAEAVSEYESARIRMTHNYVLAEFVALTVARRLPRNASLRFAAAIRSDEELEIIWVEPSVHDRAMELLFSQLDKSYSLCDAVSFVLMRDRGISTALTTDRHFEQAGFRRLLVG